VEEGIEEPRRRGRVKGFASRDWWGEVVEIGGLGVGRKRTTDEHRWTRMKRGDEVWGGWGFISRNSYEFRYDGGVGWGGVIGWRGGGGSRRICLGWSRGWCGGLRGGI
jgi:hypothetical protein